MLVGPRARRRLLLPLLATALFAASTATAFLLPLPSTTTPAPQTASTRSRLHAAADGASSSQREKKPLSWQESLELLISPTTSLAQRQVLLQDVVARAPEIRKDVEEAIREGSVDGLLTDGVKAVRRQLQEDIIPQLASEPEQAAKLLLEELPKIAQRTVDAIPRNPKDLVDTVREIGSSLPSEARNVFLRTPEGLETPHFRLLHEGDGYEIREYDSYTVAYTDMGAGGADAVGMESGGGGDSPVLGSPAMTGGAFNTLASYLFGYNDARESMAMTTPVEIRKEHARGGGPGERFTMRFVMGSQYTTENAPRPNDPAVRLTTTPPRERLAAVEFPGFATEGEVQRQLLSLLSALDRDGVSVPDSTSYRILQYNPPYTLPWLRRNELLVAVGGGVPGEGPVAGMQGMVEDVMDSAARGFEERAGEEGEGGEGDEEGSQPSDY